MTGFVNEVTADGASIHHSSQSEDNDASHLYLQAPSAICWQMAPPTRGHSEIRLTKRTDHCAVTNRAAKTDSVGPISIYFTSVLAAVNYRMRGK